MIDLQKNSYIETGLYSCGYLATMEPLEAKQKQQVVLAKQLPWNTMKHTILYGMFLMMSPWNWHVSIPVIPYFSMFFGISIHNIHNLPGCSRWFSIEGIFSVRVHGVVLNTCRQLSTAQHGQRHLWVSLSPKIWSLASQLATLSPPSISFPQQIHQPQQSQQASVYFCFFLPLAIEQHAKASRSVAA